MKSNFNIKLYVLLPLTLIVSAILWFLPLECFGIEGLTELQQRTMAVFAFAALMWLFEIIAPWATSVTTIVILLFAVSDKGFVSPDDGVAVGYREILSSFADPVIMLFLGGFVLAICANKVGIDKYLARTMLRVFGTRPHFILLGLLLVNGVFSMFMSNTATAAMMLAFLAPMLAKMPEQGNGRVALALAIPIAANIGGLGTPIGTPPNAIALGQLAKMGCDIGFGTWMMHMVPYVLVMLLISWGLLLLLYPMSNDSMTLEIEVPKTFSRDFWIVAVVFPVTIILWLTGKLTHIDSNIVALIPFAVFAITGVFTSSDFGKVDWHILWMVAGGFALGTSLNQTGLADTLVRSIPFASWSAWVLILGAGMLIYLLSTFISNSSAASLLMPMLAVIDTAMADKMSVLGGSGSLLI